MSGWGRDDSMSTAITLEAYRRQLEREKDDAPVVVVEVSGNPSGTKVG